MIDILNIEPHIISESLEDKIFLLYGEAGTRKTTVAADFDKSLLAAFEIGYKFISGVKAQPLQKWSDFKKVIRQLKTDAAKEAYKTIVLDTVTLAYSACEKYILQQFNVEDPGDIPYGKGWRYIRKEFEEVILSIPQMGYGLVLIAHSDDIKEDGEVKRSKVDIDKRPAAIIKGLSDFIIYTKKAYRDGEEQIENNKTVYAYTKLVDIETKTRSRYLSGRFEFTFKNLELEMKKAIETQKKVEGIITTDHQELHEIKEESLDSLQSSILELATELNVTSAQTKMTALFGQILQGVPLSKTTNLHKGQLTILREELLDLRDKLLSD